MVSSEQITGAIVELLEDRSTDSSICPSDAARRLAPREEEWRALMPRVREVAAGLARNGILRITSGTTELSSEEIEAGPIRLRRGPAWASRAQADGRAP